MIPNEHFDTLPANRRIGARLYELSERWACRWVWSDGRERRATFPAGWRYDGMSVMRAGWTLTGLHPDFGRPGVIPHDLLYRSRGGSHPEKMCGCTLTDSMGNAVTVDRVEADFVLRELMIAAGEDPKLCERAWRWVNRFGHHYWGGPPPGGNL